MQGRLSTGEGNFARTVQCDGTSVINFLERAGGKRPGCWAHGRRRLVEAARSGDTIAIEGLHKIARIFAIERASTLAGDSAEARQWRRLVLFVDDGNIEATNNRRERELRRLILGRKNWLFTWLDVGGERTAAILSIVASCIAHDVNPRAYLHVVTRLIVNGWPQSRLRDLLADRMLALHPELFVGDALTAPANAPLLPAPA